MAEPIGQADRRLLGRASRIHGMTEARRQAWLAYWQTLAIAAVLAVVMMPLSPLPPQTNRIAIGLVAVLVFGNAFYLLAVITSRLRMRSFAANVAVKTLLTTVTIIVGFWLMAFGIACSMNPHNLVDPHAFAAVSRVVLDQWRFGVLSLGISGLINFGFQINRKLGPGILINWVTGKYYTPREEERIFMFLDMRDSTSIAERLGTLKFSALVRDFFEDLTYPVLESRGSVSHYIGDEAVIYWAPNEGIRDANCLRLFFRMLRAIDLRGAYYRRTYGLVPEFKAGVHVGPVVATEVGELKSEIVFHGDTLNTTARIQALCNELGPLLISGELESRLSVPGDLAIEPLGAHPLKGKAHEVELFSVRPVVGRVAKEEPY